MTRDAALAILRARVADLQALGVRSIALFGSVARDGASETSDVDVLVEFTGPGTLDAYVATKDKLEEWLGCRVDLVTRKALKPRIRATIEAEALRVA